MQQELAILQQNVPETKSEVAAVIARVVQVGQVLTAKHNIQLRVDPIPKNLTAVIQPSALRQILLTAIEKLVQLMASGEIVLLAEMAGDIITLTVTGGPIVTDRLPDKRPRCPAATSSKSFWAIKVIRSISGGPLKPLSFGSGCQLPVTPFPYLWWMITLIW